MLMGGMNSSEEEGKKVVYYGEEKRGESEAKVAIGRRSRDWTLPFCGRMTNLRKMERERKWRMIDESHKRKRKIREGEELVLLEQSVKMETQ